jgi:hypothetical protein
MGAAYFGTVFSLKKKKQIRIYELSTNAMTTEERYFKSSLTSTSAVVILAKFPSTVKPQVIMDRLPVDPIR